MKALPCAPAAALLLGATIWGLLWYPYRLLAAGGLDGVWATLLTYGLGLLLGIAFFPRDAASLVRMPPLALLMGAAIGWSNLFFVLGVLEGEVMRVLLLFYLAPLWTVPIAWLLLRERPGVAGLAVVALAFTGALTMLWKPDVGAPWPTSRAEWLGLAAGFLFALGNVLVRRVQTMTDAGKSIVIWAGVAFAALVHLAESPLAAPAAAARALAQWPIVLGVGAMVVAMSLAIQFGLARMAANRAVVILLFELVVAAIGAYYLAGETMRAQDWVGGLLVVAAALASGRLDPGTSAGGQRFSASDRWG